MSKRKPGRPPTIAPPIADPALSTTAFLFAPAIFTGALLLFAVQPLIARYLLPWFGGGPGVWTTCMLFFQALLLAGYLYAHLAVRYLPTRGQIVLHLLLLAGAIAVIPIIPSATWKPADASNPVGRILLLLGATIGLPYFVLSATSPLLQAWFVKARPNVSPYRLFALSNLGSLIALIGYPTVLEPLFTRRQQAWIWSTGLILFALSCLACGVHVWRRPPSENATPNLEPAHDRGRESAGTIFLWLALPAVASILLLATTNTLTEDVAVIPLLWIVPLALYLVTFIIAFDSPRWYPRRVLIALLPLATLWMLRIKCPQLIDVLFSAFTSADSEPTEVSLFEQFAGYLTGMFLLCLFCHGELSRLKPHSSRLTSYYLLISVGGALGGAFVALVAPRIFNQFLELPLAVVAAAILCFACLKVAPFAHGHRWAALFAGTAFAFLLGEPLAKSTLNSEDLNVVARSRNFYGTLIAAELDAGGKGDPRDRALVLNHGSTSHGQQFLAPERRKETTLYYSEGSGVACAMHLFPRTENRKVGLVGLGAGTLAAYGKAGDTFRFYEIDPAVEKMARDHFTFLADSPANVEVILGDARLTLEREAPQQFDILVLDAFSGDAIPTHLLTTEAFDIYRRHVKDDGVIAVHFSNRSLDLGGVLLRQAHRLGLHVALGNPNVGWWMVMTRNDAFLNDAAERRQLRPIPTDDRGPLWTDDHVNLLKILKWESNKQ